MQIQEHVYHVLELDRCPSKGNAIPSTFDASCISPPLVGELVSPVHDIHPAYQDIAELENKNRKVEDYKSKSERIETQMEANHSNEI